MKKDICELFAGVGGFRVGFENQSKEWNTVFANQWEPSKKVQHAFECYKSHFEQYGGITEYSNMDITQVPSSLIPNFSILLGGFPCQDYSVASTGAKGIEGKKGVLWWEIERIIKDKQPPFILLENVDRLLKSPSSQRGRDFAVILGCLSKLGYYVEWRVINSADYGFQQRRRRIFIFASHNSTKYFDNISNYENNLIQSTGFFASTFKVNDIDSSTLSHTNLIKDFKFDILKISNDFKFDFKNSGFCINGKIYTAETTPKGIITKNPITLNDIVEEVVDSKYFLSDLDLEKWKYMKGPKAIERTSKTGHKYTFREGGISFPDSLDKPARTMLTSESSKNRSTHVIKDKSTGKLRLLTPIECERINGFPDNWTNTGMTHSFRYFCMGNALVVNLITLMAEALNNILNKED